MKELQAVLENYRKAIDRGERSILATVMKTSGSTYRRPGARMLITCDGQTVGSISGGCLERDVCERAADVRRSGAPTLVKYDTTAAGDIVWGLGLGCNGVVHLLIEPLGLPSEEGGRSHLHFVAESVEQRQRCVVATVFEVGMNAHAATAKVGERLSIRSQRHREDLVRSTIEDSALAVRVLADAQAALSSGRSEVKTYEGAGGRVEILIEVIDPPVPLVIFGAGHDAVPVARFARELGWRVTVVDARQAFATRERFPAVDDVILCRPEAIRERLTLDGHTVAVVMTHNYLHDKEILAALLQSPAKYVGVLGPRSRTERLLREITDEGGRSAQQEEEVERVHAPIGLDLGGDAPEQIALAIVAEVQAVLAGRSGGMLRARRAPIHQGIELEHPLTTDQTKERSDALLQPA